MDFPDRSTVEFDIKLTEKKCPQNLATLINFRKKRMKKKSNVWDMIFMPVIDICPGGSAVKKK